MTAMQPKTREEAKMLGLPDWQIDQMFPQTPAQTPTGGVFGGSPDINVPSQAPQQQAPQRGFWQGGDKFRTRDGLAAAMAVLADAFAARSGVQPGAVAGLTGGRSDAQELARKAMMAEDQRGKEREDWVWKEKYKADNPAPSELDSLMKGAGYDTTGPQASDIRRRALEKRLSQNANLVGSPETGYRWITPPTQPLPPPQPYDSVGGEYVPIPRYTPSPEEAAAELRRRRGY